ncbi:52 kDa repressor of the inhibitor of the protein kinase-like [Oopsacas minuta]|uniref:52 kDa repressor of the inhibitor of the protein kinase-like n=1 Tax=Oopsacas minuta TaxID=111878 RepID=A0AAV7KH33_9METZ|nr:52 kDa repressor of the inhibitor of the protein kinase-like [Oopsacas minuta]
MIGTLNAVFLFFGKSPKRQRFLERIVKNLAPDMHKTKLIGLCKTRWVERHTCFDSFYTMYESLCECLDAMLDPSSYHQIYEDAWSDHWDQDTRSKAQRLLSNLESSATIIAFILQRMH